MRTNRRTEKRTAGMLAILLSAALILAGFTDRPEAGNSDRIKGSENPSESFYVWNRLDTSKGIYWLTNHYEELSGRKVSEGIPILLVYTGKDGKRRYLQSPGEGNAGHGTNRSSDGWRWKSGILHYDNTTSRDFWSLIYDCSSMDGLSGSGNGEAMVTRGLLGCFFLTADRTGQFNYKGRIHSMPFQLHTWKLQEGEYVMSDQILYDTENTATECNSAGFRSYGSGIRGGSSWAVEVSGKGFAIRRYAAFDTEEGVVWDMCHGLAVNHKQGWYYLHSAPVDSYVNKWDGDNVYEVDEDSVETFEIWYGVEREARTLTGSELTVQQEFGRNSAGIPAGSVRLIPEGETLTIEKDTILLVGQNSVLVNNGTIENQGTILIQPGGSLVFWDAPEGTGGKKDRAVLSGVVKGEGDLIVRTGGRFRQRELSLSGRITDAGSLIVTDVFTAPKMTELTGVQMYAGYDLPSSGFWFPDAGDLQEELRKERISCTARISRARASLRTRSLQTAEGVLKARLVLNE